MGNLRVGDLAEVELKKVSVRALKQSNEFDKIIKEGNAGRVS